MAQKQPTIVERVHTSEYECVKRRDGSHVWRWVDRGVVQKLGGRVYGFAGAARDYVPGTRVLVKTTTVVEIEPPKAEEKTR